MSPDCWINIFDRMLLPITRDALKAIKCRLKLTGFKVQVH